LATIESRRERSYLGLFQDLTRTITSTLDENRVLDLIVGKVPEVMGVDAATIRLLNSSGEKLRLLAAHGLSRAYLDRGPVDMESGVKAALSGTPVAIWDTATDPRIHYSKAAEKEGIKSILVAPIPINGRVRGILRLLTRNPRQYSVQEIEFASAVAEQCGIALQNAFNYRKIGRLVTELERQERFLQEVIDNLDAELFVMDTEFRFVVVNRQFLKNRDVTESEVLGRHCRSLLKAEEKWIADAMETQVPVVCGPVLTAKDRKVHLEITASPVFLDHGNNPADFIICTVRDVSERLRLHEAQLAGERLQGVVETAGAAAHELNTPLFSALGTAQMAAAEIEPAHRLHDDLRSIIHNLQTISGLTRKMARITRYKSKPYVDDTSILDIDQSSAGGECPGKDPEAGKGYHVRATARRRGTAAVNSCP